MLCVRRERERRGVWKGQSRHAVELLQNSTHVCFKFNPRFKNGRRPCEFHTSVERVRGLWPRVREMCVLRLRRGMC
eukprot:4030190-Prymnesium_polylepis.2